MVDIEIRVRPGAEADDGPVASSVAGKLLEPWIAEVGGRVTGRDGEILQVLLPEDALIKALESLRQRCAGMNLRASGEVL